MAEEIKITKEQIEQALNNLNDIVYRRFVTSYLVANDKSHGDKDRQVIDKFSYQPMLASDNGARYVRDALLESREEGFLSGNVTEKRLAERGHRIILESLSVLTIGDYLNHINYEGDRSKIKLHQDKHIHDYLRNGSDEEKMRVKLLIANYITKITDNELSDAFKKEAENTAKDLETILTKDLEKE
jgi:hypothetical protein